VALATRRRRPSRLRLGPEASRGAGTRHRTPKRARRRRAVLPATLHSPASDVTFGLVMRNITEDMKPPVAPRRAVFKQSSAGRRAYRTEARSSRGRDPRSTHR
jgi:hypothetical protein